MTGRNKNAKERYDINSNSMNLILKNGLVLQDDGQTVSIEEKDIYISEAEITGIGDGPAGFVADRTVDIRHKLVLPGLINGHTHAYMTLFRNSADDLAFDEWLFQNILPMEDRLSPEDAYWGSLLGCMEMIKTGTTCFLDMHMFQNQTIRAARKIGMRAHISRGLVGSKEETGMDIHGYKSHRIREAFSEIEDHTGDLISFCLGPHAIYTCDLDFLSYVRDLAVQNNLRLNIHLSESVNEVENCKKQYGVTPVALLNRIHFFDVPVTAAHCVHVTKEDIRILKEHDVSVITNPISNMKLGNGFAPIRELTEAGVNVCIGTDGAASNNTLNLFREMTILSLVQKGIHADACALTAADTFRMGTVHAARALGKQELGRLDVGMKADCSIVNLHTPALQPVSNLLSALIYSMNGSEVESVMINGRFVMEQNRFIGIDEAEVYDHVNQIRRRIQNASK